MVSKRIKDTEKSYLRANSWRESKLLDAFKGGVYLRRPRGHRNNFICGYVKGAFRRRGCDFSCHLHQPPVLSPLWITVPRNWLFNSPTTFSRGSHQLVSLPTAMVPLCKTGQQLWSTTTYFTIDILLWYRKYCNRKCFNYSGKTRSSCQILEWLGTIVWVFCIFDAY